MTTTSSSCVGIFLQKILQPTDVSRCVPGFHTCSDCRNALPTRQPSTLLCLPMLVDRHKDEMRLCHEFVRDGNRGL